MAALRRLTPQRAIRATAMDRGTLRARLEGRIRAEFSAKEIATEARVLQRLGLLPSTGGSGEEAGAAYEALILDLLTEQVAGFYDPHGAQLYLADWLDLALQRPTMAHEIVHALQDQHFDLRRFTRPLRDQSDEQLARSALVEGDAMVAMLEWQSGQDVTTLAEAMFQVDRLEALGGGSPKLAQAPAMVRASLLFPYVHGLRFIRSLRRLHGWGRIDQAFREPPCSSEQILHPEKYLAGEAPDAIEPAPLPLLAQPELRRDTFGELGLRLLLEALAGAESAPNCNRDEALSRAVEGWGGDRMVAYGGGDGAVSVVLLTTWDSEADALEFADELSTALVNRRRTAAAGELWVAERRGRAVLLLLGVRAPTAAALTNEVWRGWRINGAPGPSGG
jgi:hypothetical protein